MIDASSGPEPLQATPCGPYKSRYHNGAGDFLFALWQADYEKVYCDLTTGICDQLANGGAMLESNVDYTQWGKAGITILWSVKGTRHMQPDGTFGALYRPFINKCMTPTYLAQHLVNRAKGFGWTLISWADFQGICASDIATICTHGKTSKLGEGYSPLCNGAHQLKQWRVTLGEHPKPAIHDHFKTGQ